MAVTLNIRSLDNIAFTTKVHSWHSIKCSVKMEAKIISIKNTACRVLTTDKILWSFDHTVNSSQKLHHSALHVLPVCVHCRICSGITARANAQWWDIRHLHCIYGILITISSDSTASDSKFFSFLESYRERILYFLFLVLNWHNGKGNCYYRQYSLISLIQT